MKSFMANPSTVERKWYVVDATGHRTPRIRGCKCIKR